MLCSLVGFLLLLFEQQKNSCWGFCCCCLSWQEFFVCCIFRTCSLKQKILLLKQLMSRHTMSQHHSVQVVLMLWDLLHCHPPPQLLLGISTAELQIPALFAFAATWWISNSHYAVTRKVGWCWLGSIKETDACCRKVLQQGKLCSDPKRLQHRGDSISLRLVLCDSPSNSSLQCSTS